MVAICKECARLREMPLSSILSVNKCDLCLTKTLCAEVETSALKSSAVMFERGFLVSEDLSKSLALIKSRKAVLAPRIKGLQIELSRPMAEVRRQEALTFISMLSISGLSKRTLGTCHKTFEQIKERIDGLTETNRATLIIIQQNLMAELAGLETKEKELSILYANCVDKILITELRTELGHEKFSKVYERAKRIYNAKNGLK